GNVSLGQRILRLDAVTPLRRSALRALGTFLSRDSLISRPVSVLRLSFLPGIDRFRMVLPEIVKAAYELPPSAMNTASVDITFAYVSRARSLRITAGLPSVADIGYATPAGRHCSAAGRRRSGLGPRESQPPHSHGQGTR